MRDRPPVLDMTPEGEFRTPPKPPLATRIMLWAILVAAGAGALSVAAFALWLALIILPVALLAAVIAWLVWRFQVWRTGGAIRNRPPDFWRP